MATEQLTITMEGGAPYGFRLFGGEGQPLVVAKLRKRSKAWDCGLAEGDVLLSINGRSCSSSNSISHAMAMNLIDSAGHHLRLQVLRRGGGVGGADQLHVSQAGSSRQRSVTPNTGPSIQVRSHSSSTPNTQFNTQWLSRVEREVRLPAGNQQRPAWNQDPGSFRSQTEVRLHLDPTESGAETGGEENTTWTAKSSVFLRSSNEKARIHPPEFSTGTFQEGLPHRLSPASPFDAKPAAATWKPPSWSPQEPPSPRSSASLGRPRSSAQTLGQDDDEELNAKENVFPAVFRPNKDVRTTTTNSFASSRIKPPAVWQPSVVPQKSSPSSNPSAVRSAPSPLAEVNFLLGPETRRGWENSAKADEEKRAFDLPPNVNKILAPSNECDRVDAFNRDKEKKKVFVDSSFYDDPSHRYPTVEEQIRMARSVALSLTAPDNASARGHRMFIKRKETSDKWVVDAEKVDRLVHQRGHRRSEPDPYYNPTPWGGTGPGWKAAGSQGTGGMPPPPPLPTSKLFAPKRYLDDEDGSGERSRALSADEFERLRLFSQKTTHCAISPQVCFSLAEDLRQSKGKGGRMFAKRRAKADEWAVEGGAREVGPDPKLLQRISGGYGGGEPSPVEKGPVSVTADGGDVGPAAGTPVNRLKEMLELPKAKMTPWDAVAEYGNVDLAFEHLEGICFVRPSKSNPYADRVATSLQEATQKRSGPRPGGHLPPPTGPGSVRPQSVQGHSPMEPPERSRTRNSFTAPTVSSWSQSQSTSNTTFEFSPPTHKGSASGYRPVTFQPSSGTNSLSGGRYSDL